MSKCSAEIFYDELVCLLFKLTTAPLNLDDKRTFEVCSDVGARSSVAKSIANHPDAYIVIGLSGWNIMDGQIFTIFLQLR